MRHASCRTRHPLRTSARATARSSTHQAASSLDPQRSRFDSSRPSFRTTSSRSSRLEPHDSTHVYYLGPRAVRTGAARSCSRAGRRRRRHAARVASTTPIADAIAIEAANLAAADPQQARPVAIEYSDAHETRAKTQGHELGDAAADGDGICARPAAIE